MEIPTNYPFCVACFRNGANSREHIILESLGGLLWARILCECCNSKFGSDLDKEVTKDPQFRIAVDNLQHQIRHVYLDYNRRNRFLGAGKDGPAVKMALGTDGEFRMLWTKLEDGSVLRATPDAREDLERELKGAGKNQAEIDAALDLFDRAPNNVQFEVAPGIPFIKRDVATIQPDLRQGELISDRLIAKIAYIHLCLCVTPEIMMTHRAFFEPIVAYVRGGHLPEYVEIRRGLRGKYQPNHLFRVDCDEGRTTLKFQLFGMIAFDFVLSGLTIPNTQYPVIIHNLVRREVWASRNWDEFREGKYGPIGP